MTTRAKGRGETSPADDEFLEQLHHGGELLAAGKVIEAKDFLERAHQLQPRNEKAQNMLGLTYFKLGLFDRAAELYEMLVRDNPVDPTLRVNLGLVYLKTNALQRAAREFETATDLDADHKKAHNYLGLALAQMGEYGRAREHFLLSGSDAMAEKMTRAIAGEGYSRSASAPTPSQPMRAREGGPQEGGEAAREPAGGAGHDAMAAPTPPQAPRAPQAPEAPQAPAQAQPAARAPQAPQGEGDWGAQFGLDETPGRAVSRTASAAAPVEEEIRFAEDEGPSALTGSEEMPVLTALPEDAEEAAPPATVPGTELQEDTEPDATFDETSAALAMSVPLTPVPLTKLPEVAPGLLAGRKAAVAPPAEAPAREAQPVAPPPVVARPAAAEGEAPTAGVPLLTELAPAVALTDAEAGSAFVLAPPGCSVAVNGELLTRLEGLVAWRGALTFQPEMKRFRGRATDKPFGEGPARMVRARGQGVLFLEPAERRTFLAVDLGEESAYFRDECVFAFEEPVMFENGRVPSDIAPDLDLVHLRGQGRVLLSLPGPLRSVQVGMQAAVTVPLTHLVGWLGGLTPRVVPLLKSPSGETLRTAVELSGEGFALIALAVR